MGKTAAIVVIGDEILSGKFADENAPYLIRELRELGVALKHVAMIPDDVATIGATVADLSARFDYVFTSGGVGPTHDDVTVQGIAHGFGTQVVIDDQLAAAVRAFFGPKLGELNIRLAEVPEGCDMIPPDERTKWPTTRFRNVYILPGVPAIFRRKFESIRGLFQDDPFFVGRIFVRSDEGSLASHLSEVDRDHPTVSVGSYPRHGEEGFTVLITLEGKDPDQVAAAQAALRARLGDLVTRSEDPAVDGAALPPCPASSPADNEEQS